MFRMLRRLLDIHICLVLMASGALPTASTKAVEIIAHRGGYALAPENTLSAFRAASGFVEWMEFDIHTTADGQLVVIHDHTVDRTTDGKGNVADMTLPQMRALDAGMKFSPAFAGESIPTLAEALRAIPAGIRPIIDRKSGSADAIIRSIVECNAESTVLLSSVDWAFLNDVKSKNPRIALAPIGSGTLTTNMLHAIKTMGAYSIIWEKTSITPSLVESLHASAIRVFAWTLDAREIRPFMNLGIDGIIVSDPRLAFQLRSDNKPSNTQIADGIVAYWKLDEDDGSRSIINVLTHEKEEISATSNPPQRGQGMNTGMRRAVLLNGLQDYLPIPQDQQVDIDTNAVSMSLWVNLAVLPSAMRENFAGIYDSEEDAYIIYLDKHAKEMRFKLTDTSHQTIAIGIPESLLATGIWYHVAAVYDGDASPSAGQAMLYLDGRLISVITGSATTPRYGLTNKVRRGQRAAIGRNGNQSAYHFHGLVDDVAIWRRALKPAEIRHIHASGIAGVPLETLIMRMQVSGISIASGQPEIRFHVTNAIAIDRQFRLGMATHPAGPYVEYPAPIILDRSSGRFQIPAFEASGAHILFFRVESP